MTTKRKLITAVASLGILVILAGVALGVALAALTGNVTSGFTINYTAYNVSAAISGSWGYTGDFMKTMTSNGENKILFTGSETNGTSTQKSFDPLGNIELSASNPSVTFKYSFLNFDSSKALPISFTLDGDMENLDVNYSVKTFDGSSTTTTPSGSMTDLPTTINNISVPYSGYSSYDEMYQEMMDMLSTNEDMITMLQLLFTVGDEAVMEALNAMPDLQVEDVLMYYLIAIGINSFRIFMENGSEEQALEYLDNFDFYGETIPLGFYCGLTSNIINECARIGRYDLAFNSALRRVDYDFRDFGYNDDNYENVLISSDWKLAYQIMKYNVLDTLYTDGYDAAINLVDSLYEEYHRCFINLADDDWVDIEHGAYFMNNFNAFKESLSEYVGNNELSTVEKRKAAFMADAQDFVSATMLNVKGYIALAQGTLVDIAVESNLVPYTEITVTISIDDDTDEAYLNSGNFNFVLGQV